jgi:hypothetical protein
MEKTKRTFLKKETKEKGLIFIKEILKNSNFKETSFFGNNYKK